MTIINIADNVLGVGSLDPDRRLFDELITLPDGTSYNSYLIKGKEKNALIDTVDPEKTHELLDKLKKSGIEKIDYIVANHAEQDHSGSIPAVLDRYPDAKVVTNKRCKGMLQSLLHIHDNKFLIVEDQDTTSLGGFTLRFILTPWVHCPETMVTYLEEEKILFSCDFFGSHMADNSIRSDFGQVRDAAKRYYAEIMMPFRKTIMTNMEKLEGLDIDFIAPSHGPIYKDPKSIMESYSLWISDKVENKAVIAYVSMHGSTKALVSRLSKSLIEGGISTDIFHLTEDDIGELAMDSVDSATIILAAPTVIVGPHPMAGYAAMLLNAIRPKAKHLAVIGSYGWAPTMKGKLESMMPNLNAEMLGPVFVKGLANGEDLKKIDSLANQIVQKHNIIFKQEGDI